MSPCQWQMVHMGKHKRTQGIPCRSGLGFTCESEGWCCPAWPDHWWLSFGSLLEAFPTYQWDTSIEPAHLRFEGMFLPAPIHLPAREKGNVWTVCRCDDCTQSLSLYFPHSIFPHFPYLSIASEGNSSFQFLWVGSRELSTPISTQGLLLTFNRDTGQIFLGDLGRYNAG